MTRDEEYEDFWNKVKAGKPFTLFDWITYGDSDWPDNSEGFRVGTRGRVTWQGAYFPDGSDGNWVTVYRGHPAVLCRYPHDTVMTFVYKE